MIAGALLLATTVATGAWSVMSAREVSRVVGTTVADDQRAIDVASTLAGALEREDDALLLALSDPVRGRVEIVRQREAVGDALVRVEHVLLDPDRSNLDSDIAAYHAAVDALAAANAGPDASTRYLEAVNPRLRHAIATINRIRDRNFRSSLAIAEWSRDRSTSSMQVVALISAIAFLLLCGIAFHFARVVVQPLRAMSRTVDAIRRNDFSGRVAIRRSDELGKLGEGLNRMSDELAEFRQANIVEVIRAKETLEATLAALPDAVVVIGPDRVISSTNPRADALLGGVVVGSALGALPIPEATRAAVDAVLGDAPSTSDVDLAKAIELGSQSRKLLPRVVPISGLPEARRGAVLVLSDVTELVRLDQMRIELVAVASHELRTPLTTLRMTVLMLQEHAAALGERERALVATAVVGVQQLSALVDEFLNLTQIEAGQLRLSLAKVSPIELIERSVREIASTADEAGITIEQQRTGDPPPLIAGDPSRLSIVLGNLLSNAVKYTPRGGRIQIDIQATDRDVVLSVGDSGPGVPTEHRERVFERFFRVEHTRAARSNEVGITGVGIGLYIARQIVVAHGGSICCEATETGGAKFVVRLPIASVRSE